MSRYVSIDLELEQPNGPQVNDSKSDKPKIIQLGVVAFELDTENPVILEQRTFHLRYDKGLSTFIKSLTSINDEDLANPECEDSLEAINELTQVIKRHNASRRIVEWGSGDLSALREEAGLTIDDAFKLGIARNTINVRVLYDLFMIANGLNPKGGLGSAIKRMNLVFQSTTYKGRNKGIHWAEADALNTAVIFNKIMSLIKGTFPN